MYILPTTLTGFQIHCKVCNTIKPKLLPLSKEIKFDRKEQPNGSLRNSCFEVLYKENRPWGYSNNNKLTSDNREDSMSTCLPIIGYIWIFKHVTPNFACKCLTDLLISAKQKIIFLMPCQKLIATIMYVMDHCSRDLRTDVAICFKFEIHGMRGRQSGHDLFWECICVRLWWHFIWRA